MADTKISQLPAQTTLATNDVLPLVSTDNSETRKITVANASKELSKLGLSVGTATPGSPYTGQPWIDINSTPVLKLYSGSQWNTTVNTSDLSTYTGSTSITTLGTITTGTVPVARVSGLAASATTDTTSATNISSGTLDAARLPSTIKPTNIQNPSASTPCIVTDAAGSAAVTVSSINGDSLAGNRNRIINGSMMIDQRNAGAAQTITAGAALAYTVDRWYAYCTGANVTGQRVQGAAPGMFRYQFTGAANVTTIGFGQRIEQINCAALAGTTVTLSADLANSLLTTVTWTAFYANSADAFGTLASPTRTQIATGTWTVNSTVTRYSAQIAIPAAATTGIEIVFSVGAQTSGTWTIGAVQLEPGSVATPFERRSYGLELMLCQRYFETSYPSGNAVGSVTDGAGSVANVALNVTDFYSLGCLRWNVRKRVSPTFTAYNPITGTAGKFRGVNDNSNAATVVTSIGLNESGITGISCASSNMTANFIYIFHYTAVAEL